MPRTQNGWSWTVERYFCPFFHLASVCAGGDADLALVPRTIITKRQTCLIVTFVLFHIIRRDINTLELHFDGVFVVDVLIPPDGRRC